MNSLVRTKEDLNQLIIPLLAISCTFIFIPSATPSLGAQLVLKMNGLGLSLLLGGAALFTLLIVSQITGCSDVAWTPSRSDTDRFDAPADFQAIVAQARTTEPINIIAQIHHLEPQQFEKLLARLYYKLGYTVTRCSHTDLDTNIDLIIHKNGELCAVQCKYWKNWSLGVRPLHDFVDDLHTSGIPSGIVITLNGYTAAAKRLADEHRIQFIDEFALAKMLAHTDASFDPEILSILAQ
jgi:restriction endonuclease Mrr